MLLNMYKLFGRNCPDRIIKPGLFCSYNHIIMKVKLCFISDRSQEMCAIQAPKSIEALRA